MYTEFQLTILHFWVTTKVKYCWRLLLYLWILWWSLTWSANNPSIIWTIEVVVVVVVVTNSCMTAAEKRRLTSSTPHINQEYWASPLSKGKLTDRNTYHKEKYYHHISYMARKVPGVAGNPFQQRHKEKVLIKSSNVADYSCWMLSHNMSLTQSETCFFLCEWSG